jgi:hypothetical protein
VRNKRRELQPRRRPKRLKAGIARALAASAAPVPWLQLCSLQRGAGLSTRALHTTGAINTVQLSMTTPRIAMDVTRTGDSSSADLARRLRGGAAWLADIARPRQSRLIAMPREPIGSRKVVSAHGSEGGA